MPSYRLYESLFWWSSRKVPPIFSRSFSISISISVVNARWFATGRNIKLYEKLYHTDCSPIFVITYYLYIYIVLWKIKHVSLSRRRAEFNTRMNTELLKMNYNAHLPCYVTRSSLLDVTARLGEEEDYRQWFTPDYRVYVHKDYFIRLYDRYI